MYIKFISFFKMALHFLSFCKPICKVSQCVFLPFRTKYYRKWYIPFTLNDDQNLVGRGPDIREEWLNEMNEVSNSSDEINTDISRLPKRLKSRMKQYKEFLPIEDHAETSLSYQRKAFAYFGSSLSGIDPNVCWPSRQEIDLHIEKEKLSQLPLETMLENSKTKKEAWDKMIQSRMEKIDSNLKKMPQAISQYNQRLSKEEEAVQAHEKKRLDRIEEARDFFGYAVDTNDPKFIRRKEALEAEEKKKRKLERKKKRLSRM